MTNLLTAISNESILDALGYSALALILFAFFIGGIGIYLGISKPSKTRSE